MTEYERYPVDGLPITEVGEWAKEKHERLRRYIDITRAVRRKFIGPGTAGATYIDLFSAAGKARIRGTEEIIDGSPVAAWQMALDGGAPFSSVHIADLDTELLHACEQRLIARQAPVVTYAGQADETVHQVAKRLNPSGLHFAFLDPCNLEPLTFSIIERLAKFQRMDLLIHVSIQDLNRNLRRYIDSSNCPLDTFAPGWRDKIDSHQPDHNIRQQVFAHWLSLIRSLDMQPSEGVERVTGSKNQPLYWLVLASRHKRAHEFWDKIRNIDGQSEMMF